VSSARILTVWLAACLAGLPTLFAQQQVRRDSHIGYVFPAGGQRGTTFEVTVGGQFLDGTTEALASGSGVRLTVVRLNKPIPDKRFNELREYIEQERKKYIASLAPPAPPPKPVASATPASSPTPPVYGTPSPAPSPKLYASTTPAATPGPRPPFAPGQGMRFFGPERPVEILKQAGATDEEIKKFLELRKERNDPKRQPNQQLAESVTLRVEIAPDAQPGPREVRLVTGAGVSNPLAFCVGTLPEQSLDGTIGGTVDTAVRVSLPVVLNGQILPGAVHHYSFQARRGAHLVVVAQARDLMPYLADTVPGWFQAAVALYDAKGTQVAYADHYRFNPDPVLHYDVPQDGVYLIEIRDSLYRGREDFVYRVSVGELPFVTDIYPLGGQLGLSARVNVSGWNLAGRQAMAPTARAEGVYPVPYLSNGLATEDVLFAYDPLPQLMAWKPANAPYQAQHVTVPVVINGRINHPGDVDGFQISCRAGEKIVAEVYARRLNSPLDSWLKVVDAKAHQLAFNDDCVDKGAGLLTNCSDSRLTFTAPANGLYYVIVGDAQGQGGPEYSYRLRISDPIPDFALRVTPSAIAGRPGATVPVTVYALRKDGFAGEIALGLKGNSPGLVLDGGRIQAGQDQVRATLTLPLGPIDKAVKIEIEGHAFAGGRDVLREAVPADDMVQAFMYHHLVPAREMIALVSGSMRGRPPIRLLGERPMVLKVGGTSQAMVSLEGRSPFILAETQLELSEPPDGISIGGIALTPIGATISFKADPAKTRPGSKGNLIVEEFVERTPPPINGKSPGKKRFSMGYLPAIPFEVAGK